MFDELYRSTGHNEKPTSILSFPNNPNVFNYSKSTDWFSVNMHSES